MHIRALTRYAIWQHIGSYLHIMKNHNSIDPISPHNNSSLKTWSSPIRWVGNASWPNANRVQNYLRGITSLRLMNLYESRLVCILYPSSSTSPALVILELWNYNTSRKTATHMHSQTWRGHQWFAVVTLTKCYNVLLEFKENEAIRMCY